MRILRKRAVAERTGYSEAHIDRLSREGRFPRKMKLGEGKLAACGWVEAEVDAWLEARAAARDRDDPPPPMAAQAS